MSATGRTKKDGTKTERSPADFYATPAWCTTRLLRHVELPGGWWLEPSAGDGAIIRAVNSVRSDVAWEACEIRELSAQPDGVMVWWRGDFLRPDAYGPGRCDPFNVCIGNPPFSLAAEFIDQALNCSDQAVMLLRLNFLGSSRKRRVLFDRRGMPDVYVLPERPSFTGKGTDACEYAWMRWFRDGSQKGEVKILWEPKVEEKAA